MTIVGNSNDADYQELVAGDDLILACEVSRASAPVEWYCNDRLLINDSRTCIECYGTLRKIMISHVQHSDSGKYTCDAVNDKMICVVRIQGMNPMWRLRLCTLKEMYILMNLIFNSVHFHERATSYIYTQGG